ncbi:hypothetical protein [Sagittula sp. S175]|uniref:hypothetical protein n=1 Tax=Sagittula sp. S175 TaxID=3415129 RepID=UPI003C7A8EBA
MPVDFTIILIAFAGCSALLLRYVLALVLPEDSRLNRLLDGYGQDRRPAASAWRSALEAQRMAGAD